MARQSMVDRNAPIGAGICQEDGERFSDNPEIHTKIRDDTIEYGCENEREEEDRIQH